MEVKLNLPYPTGLSVNHCWKRSRYGVYLDPRVKQYRLMVEIVCSGHTRLGKSGVDVMISCFYPNKRKRDLDNILKVTLDALVGAKVFDDDSQIVKLGIEHAGYTPEGRLEVRIREHLA